MLVQLFYVSVVALGVSPIEVQTILSVAQVRNRRLDVTGVLAQSDGHFAQVLEGRDDAVAEVMTRVIRDRRHTGVRIVYERPIERRQFAHWAMGLVRRDDMAAEMTELHETGRIGSLDTDEVVARLLTMPP